MDFNQRKAEAYRLVDAFLADYKPPRGIDDPSLASRVANIADAFARRMPTKGDYAEAVERVLMGLRDTHQSNTWPPQAAFVERMPASERKQYAALEQYETNKRDLLQSRMEAGDAVAEVDVWGVISGSLSLGAGVLEKYRKGSVAKHVSTYRGGAAEVMRKKYGPIVDLYFEVPR